MVLKYHHVALLKVNISQDSIDAGGGIRDEDHLVHVSTQHRSYCRPGRLEELWVRISNKYVRPRLEFELKLPLVICHSPGEGPEGPMIERPVALSEGEMISASLDTEHRPRRGFRGPCIFLQVHFGAKVSDQGGIEGRRCVDYDRCTKICRMLFVRPPYVAVNMINNERGEEGSPASIPEDRAIEEVLSQPRISLQRCVVGSSIAKMSECAAIYLPVSLGVHSYAASNGK